VSGTRRQALYFPTEMLAEILAESKRQDRSVSWLIQKAWRLARHEMQKIPSTSDYIPEDLDRDVPVVGVVEDEPRRRR